jgi:hypothetical protein
VDAPGLFVNIAKYLRSDKSTKMEVIFITTYFQYLGLNEIFFLPVVTIASRMKNHESGVSFIFAI